MKRLSQKRKIFLECRRRRIERRRAARRIGLKVLRKFRRLDKDVIRAPDTISLESGQRRHELMSFLAELRTRVLKEERPTVINFFNTERMIAAGSLLFTAELYRICGLAKNKQMVRCIPPRHIKVSQVLKQIGVYELLGYKKAIKPSFNDVVHWRYACGHQVEGEKYENILGDYDGKVAESLLGSLFRGITEAMTNCHHHAYIKPRPDGIEDEPSMKRWWMFSQEQAGYLTVAFCDLGVGIPETLPVTRPGVWKKLLSLGKAGSDSWAIKQAIDDSITRTKKHYRGKGLRQLLEAAKENEGLLRIFSNRGCYTFQEVKESTRDYSESIMGTLILWKVRIRQESLL